MTTEFGNGAYFPPETGEKLRTVSEYFTFDADEFNAQLERELTTTRGLAATNKINPETLEERIAQKIKDAEEMREWLVQYSGKIPKNWGDTSMGTAMQNVWGDILAEDIEISADMADACVDHPAITIVYNFGTSHELTAAQLDRISSRKLPAHIVTSIEEFQCSI